MSVLTRSRRHEAPAAVPVPSEIPRGVAASRLSCQPGTSRDVLRELRAETETAVDPRALRHAFDRDTWLPAVGLRIVPLTTVHRDLDDIDTVAADIRTLVDHAPFVRHEDAVQMALAPIVEMLAAPQPRPLNTAYALRESAHDTRQLCITNYGPFDLYNIDGWRELFDVEQWIQTEALKHAEAAAPATTLAEVA